MSATSPTGDWLGKAEQRLEVLGIDGTRRDRPETLRGCPSASMTAFSRPACAG